MHNVKIFSGFFKGLGPGSCIIIRKIKHQRRAPQCYEEFPHSGDLAKVDELSALYDKS